MLKHSALLLSTTLLVNGLAPSISLAYDGENKSTTIDKSTNQVDCDSTLDLSIEEIFYQNTLKNPRAVAGPIDGIYTWEYVNTTNQNNVFYSTSSDFLITTATGGLSSSVIKHISSTTGKIIAGYLFNKASISKQKYYWWTTKKYMDEDLGYFYFKYDVKIYSDSKRTKLVDSYIDIEKVRKI